MDISEEATPDFRRQPLTLSCLQSELESFGNDTIRRILREELEEYFHMKLPTVLREVLVAHSENTLPSKPKTSARSGRECLCPSPSSTSCSSAVLNPAAMKMTSPMISLDTLSASANARSQNLFANRHIRTFTVATEPGLDPFRRKEKEQPMSRAPNLLEDLFPIYGAYGSKRKGANQNSRGLSALPPMPCEASDDEHADHNDITELPCELDTETMDVVALSSDVCKAYPSTATATSSIGDGPKLDWVGVSSKIQNRRFSTGSAQVLPLCFVEQASHRDDCHRALVLLVKSPWFDYITLSLISINAVTIGWQADYMARNKTESVPFGARIIEIGFCTGFTLELTLKIAAFGRGFFYQKEWRWNVFDSMVVGLQLAEEFLTLVVHSLPLNFSFLRLVRLLRLVRVVRLIRLLRLIGELRTLVTSLAGSFKSFVWTIALLFGLIYTTGIFFTQLVTDHRIEASGGTIEHESTMALQSYFGSLDATILVLIQSIFNGIAWREVTNPLHDQIHWVLVLFFCTYITFCMMAMMNVVTGVFVDCALNSAKKDKEIYMVNSVRQMFRRLDLDLSGALDWEQFEAALGETEMREYFKQIDVDIAEARGVFDLLDMDGSGRLSAEEFVSGCMRISGNAKALDSIVLLHELRHVRTLQAQLNDLLENATVQWQQTPQDTKDSHCTSHFASERSEN